MITRPTPVLSANLLGCLVLSVGLLSGCTQRGVYPVVSGSHARVDRSDPRQAEELKKRHKLIVWSNHEGVGHWLMSFIQDAGETVVERARLNQILNEQKVRLTQTREDEADILRVGNLMGADRVIFAETRITPEAVSRTYVDAYGGASSSGTVYHVSVAVRSVAVDSGEVRWSGSANYPGPVTNPDQAAVYLAQAAVHRALCPIGEGYVWEEISASGGGCVQK